MQKEFREGFLKILKGYENLQRPVSKVSRNDLKNFESNSEPSDDPLKSFKDASEGKVKSRTFNEDLDED